MGNTIKKLFLWELPQKGISMGIASKSIRTIENAIKSFCSWEISCSKFCFMGNQSFLSEIIVILKVISMGIILKICFPQ